MMEYYLSIKMSNTTLFATTWMGLDIIVLDEIRHKEKRNFI